MERETAQVATKETDIRILMGKVCEFRSILASFESDFKKLQSEVFFKGEEEATPKDIQEKASNKIAEVSDVIEDCYKIQSRIRDIYYQFNNILS